MQLPIRIGGVSCGHDEPVCTCNFATALNWYTLQAGRMYSYSLIPGLQHLHIFLFLSIYALVFHAPLEDAL